MLPARMAQITVCRSLIAVSIGCWSNGDITTAVQRCQSPPCILVGSWTNLLRDPNPDLDAAIVGDNPIPRDKVLLWISAATDLPTLAKLYVLTGEHYYRIQPNLGRDSTCDLIQRYLLECIRQNVTNQAQVQDRWEATATLHLWFRRLVEMEGTSDVLTKAAHSVTELFLTNGEEVRASIEQGFLEHALETITLRPYFEHWSSDPRLQEAWNRALEWGKAHPDFTWKLLQQGLPRARQE